MSSGPRRQNRPPGQPARRDRASIDAGCRAQPDMRWDPIRDLRVLQERANRHSNGWAADWTPAVDVYETPDCWVVFVEVAGVSPDDVKIQFQENGLVIRGERSLPEDSPDAYHRVERAHGAFARRIEFAEPIDRERVTAEFRDGLLTITMPKFVVAESRRVEIL